MQYVSAICNSACGIGLIIEWKALCGSRDGLGWGGSRGSNEKIGKSWGKQDRCGWWRMGYPTLTSEHDSPQAYTRLLTIYALPDFNGPIETSFHDMPGSNEKIFKVASCTSCAPWDSHSKEATSWFWWSRLSVTHCLFFLEALSDFHSSGNTISSSWARPIP